MIACKKHGIKEEIIMKKRLISIALASVMALSLAGCGGSAGGLSLIHI